MADVKSKSGYAPLCLTLVFMFGAVVGVLTVDLFHTPLIRSIIALGFATLAFHLTHQPYWLSKFFNKK